MGNLAVVVVAHLIGTPLTFHDRIDELIDGSNAIMRQIPMVSQSVQAWARTSLVILARSFPGMFASCFDTLSFGIELWSREWQQASPR